MMLCERRKSVTPMWRGGTAGKFFAVLLLFMSLTGCERVQVNVIDSGYEIVGGESRLAWLDDHRVMFNKPTKGVRGRIPAPPGMYIWDVDTNTMERYADVGEAPCYDNGYIHYFTHYKGAGKKRIFFYKYGEMGKEKTIKLKWNDDVGFNPHDCRLMSQVFTKEMSRKKLRNLQPLRHEDGYIDIKDTMGNIKLIKPSGEVLELSIPTLDARSMEIYYPFKSAYYLYSSGGPGYWLYPDGRVEKVVLPQGPWFDVSSSIFQRPTRSGVLVIVFSALPDKEGMFWVHNGKVKKLFGKMIKKASISPDGCKVAFLREGKYGSLNGGNYILQALDVCKLEKQR